MKKYLVNFNAVSVKSNPRVKTWKNQMHKLRKLGTQKFFDLGDSNVKKLLESAVNVVMRSLIRGKVRAKDGHVKFIDRNVDFIIETYRKEKDGLVNEAYIHSHLDALKRPERDAWMNCFNGAYIAFYRAFDFLLGKQTRKNGRTVGRKTSDSLDANTENGLDYALPRRFENSTVTRIDLARACKDGIDLYILDCLESGYTQAYIANTLHKSQQAISKRIKALRERLNTFTGFLYIMEA